MTAGRAVQGPSTREALVYAWRLLWLVRPYWGPITRGTSLGLVVGIVGLLTPLLTKGLVDVAYPARDVGLMHVLVLGILVVSIASAAMGMLRGYYAQVVSARLASALGLLFFNHLQHLPLSFYEERRVGEIMARFGDLRTSSTRLASAYQTVLVSGAYLILIPPVLLFLNWRLTLVAIAAAPVTTVIATTSARLLRRAWKRNAELAAELSAQQIETLSHICLVKTTATERQVYEEQWRQMHMTLESQLRATLYATLTSGANSGIRLVGSTAFAWYAWTLILRGDLTLGSFLAFSAYLGYLTGPLGSVTGLFAGFQQTAVALGRTFEYLDQEPEQDPALATVPAPAIGRPVAGDVRFEHVSFGYGTGKEVLSDISLTLSAGRIAAILGESGVGKSSLLRLLCRLVEPRAGQITIGGIPLPQYPLIDLRRQIAVVWQDVGLLRGTLLDNLTFGAREVSRDRVENALGVCRLDGLVGELPEGLATPVAEWGASLSGGQRQRIALARAVLLDRPLVLLDEATSQLDIETEEAVLRAMMSELRGRTVVLVTHRLSTAAHADSMSVLKAGQIGTLDASVGVGVERAYGAVRADRSAVLAAHAWPVRHGP